MTTGFISDALGQSAPGIILEADGQRYDNLLDAVVVCSMQAMSGTFDLTLSMDNYDNFPISIDSSIRILVEGQPRISGVIDEMESGFDKDSDFIKLSGRDITGDVIDSSISGPINLTPPISLESVIRKVLTTNGIQSPVRPPTPIEGPPDLSNPIIRVLIQPGLEIEDFKDGELISADIGDNMFEFINKYCALRQVLATTDGNGNILITRGATEKITTQLIRRYNPINRSTLDDPRQILKTEINRANNQNNILSATWRNSIRNRFYRYLVKSQQNLNAIDIQLAKITNSSVTDQKGEAFDGVIRKTRTFVTTDSSGESQNAKQNALWIADKNKSDGFSGRCVVPGFSHSTGIWKPNFLVDVIDERNFTEEQLKDPEKLIKTVTYNFADHTTELELVDKNSFNLNAQKTAQEAKEEEMSNNGDLGIPGLSI